MTKWTNAGMYIRASKIKTVARMYTFEEGVSRPRDMSRATHIGLSLCALDELYSAGTLHLSMALTHIHITSSHTTSEADSPDPNIEGHIGTIVEMANDT